MASEIRALKARNDELSSSLEAAMKRIDELEARDALPDGVDEDFANDLRACASTCVDDDFVSIDDDARIIRVDGDLDSDGLVYGAGWHVAAWIWLPDESGGP